MITTRSACRWLRALCAGALLALAASAAPARAQAAGEAAYQELCASCHRVPASILGRYLAMSSEARRAEFDRFFRRHHARDDAKRRAIIDWIENTQIPPR